MNNIEEKIEEYKNIYGFRDVILSGYAGGYPIFTFVTFMKQNENMPSEKEIQKYLRNAEMGAGRELGVGLNFRRTAHFTRLEDGFSICGHVLIIDRVLKMIYEK
ncbi:MAG: hypothetical protein E7254_04010 [Lachnospiraceae bacterium]|nr:hypothetical protein [Lachnospiraceae bacterium]